MPFPMFQGVLCSQVICYLANSDTNYAIPGVGHFLRGGGTERGVCDICVARACADARHTSDTHAFPQAPLCLLCQNQG